jgi:serine/threonine protein kinase
MCMLSPSHTHTGYNDIPLTVNKQRYHSITPLPSDGRALDKTFPTITYKCTRYSDNRVFIMRRTMGVKVPAERAAASLQPWLRMQQSCGVSKNPEEAQHPGIVAVRDVFATKDFKDRVDDSLCFVYEYCPGAISFQNKYFGPNGGVPVAESQLWSYLCQLVSVLVSVHGSGLALCIIHPSKVLLTEKV